MNKTYHEMIEAVYRGGAYNFHGLGRVEKIAPLRHQPKYLDPLVTCPSYHFGQMLAHLGDEFPAGIGEPPVENILHYLARIEQQRAAIVYDTVKDSGTWIVTFNDIGGTLAVAICCYDGTGKLSVEPDRWVSFTYKFAQSRAAWGIVWVAAVGLELLANPNVQHVMAEPPSGVAKFSAARIKRGDSPVSPMKLIHLTKKVYVGGRAIYPRGESTGGERSPHDRSGHYRHSKRRIAGWDGPLTETSGEWAGVTCYRRWIDDVKVKGGAAKSAPGRGHPKAAQPKATQYRVVQ